MLARRRLLALAPLGAFATADAALWLLHQPPQVIAFGPHGVSSPLLGHPVPDFSLPGLASASGFSSLDLAQSRQPVLLNFFASWCEPCQQEMPILLRLARKGLAIWGIDFRDTATDAKAFLRQRGDPYRRVAQDHDGRVAREFGLDGVPESFLVGSVGIVRWHWVGGLSEDIVREQLEPLLRPEPSSIRA